MPVGAKFSAPVQTGPGAHPAFCTMCNGSFPGVKSGRGVTLTTHSFLVPWSRKGRGVPLLSVWAVRPIQSLSACTRVHFYFFTFVHRYVSGACTFVTVKSDFFSMRQAPIVLLIELSRNSDAMHRNEISVLYWNYSPQAGTENYTVIFVSKEKAMADPSGRAVQGVGLPPLACWDCGFESRRGHESLSVVSVACCQGEVSVTSWSLVQRSPTDCSVSLFVI